jgi:hypothetical protein
MAVLLRMFTHGGQCERCYGQSMVEPYCQYPRILTVNHSLIIDQSLHDLGEIQRNKLDGTLYCNYSAFAMYIEYILSGAHRDRIARRSGYHSRITFLNFGRTMASV